MLFHTNTAGGVLHLTADRCFAGKSRKKWQSLNFTGSAIVPVASPYVSQREFPALCLDDIRFPVQGVTGKRKSLEDMATVPQTSKSVSRVPKPARRLRASRAFRPIRVYPDHPWLREFQVSLAGV